MVKKVFIKGAWLHTLDTELSEEEFIAKSGGMDALEPYRAYPFVSLVLDNPEEPILVGHTNGRTISLTMSGRGHEHYQTMEWK